MTDLMLLFQLSKSISGASGHRMNHSVVHVSYFVFGSQYYSLLIYRSPDRLLELRGAPPCALQSDSPSIPAILSDFHIVDAAAKPSGLTPVAPYSLASCSAAPAPPARCLQNTASLAPQPLYSPCIPTPISNSLSTPLIPAVFLALSSST